MKKIFNPLYIIKFLQVYNSFNILYLLSIIVIMVLGRKNYQIRIFCKT